MTNTVVSYRTSLAKHLNSVVAAILIQYVINKCKEEGVDSFESATLQFELGFSDVEFYSALKTLRNCYAMETKNTSGGKLYKPNDALIAHGEKS